jgi:GxxExxY protein
METIVHESDVMYADEVYQIIEFALKILNEVGHGFHEKIYENGLMVEFKKNNIEYLQQPDYKIEYEGEVLGIFRPDLIFHGKIVIDTKTIDRITDHERGKMINYLRKTEKRLGLIINFKYAKLDWERIIL